MAYKVISSEMIMKRKTVVFLEPGKTEKQKPTSSLEIEVLLAGGSEPWTGITR